MKKNELRQDITPNGVNAFKLNLVSDNLSHLMGEVLTVIDASVEGERNKAMKDLIKRAFSDKQGWFSELAWKYEEEIGSGHGPHNDWEAGLVPYDQDKTYSFA